MSLAASIFLFKRFDNLVDQISILSRFNLSIFLFVDYDEKSLGANIQEFYKVFEEVKNDFQHVDFTVISRDRNVGLRSNILMGLDEVSNRHEYMLVFEDDIKISVPGVSFLICSLDKYRDTDVYHINGWSHPNFLARIMDPIVFSPWAFCWGWATWASKWRELNLDSDSLIFHLDDKKFRFNVFGSYGFFDQLTLNKSGYLNTWAIFWTATVFLKGGRCVTPSVSFFRPINDSKFTHPSNNFLFAEQSVARSFVAAELPSISSGFSILYQFQFFLYLKIFHRVKSLFKRLVRYFR